jgi:hypothetical protein
MVAGMASSYRNPWLAKPLTVVRAGHAREKTKINPNAIALKTLIPMLPIV